MAEELTPAMEALLNAMAEDDMARRAEDSQHRAYLERQAEKLWASFGRRIAAALPSDAIESLEAHGEAYTLLKDDCGSIALVSLGAGDEYGRPVRRGSLDLDALYNERTPRALKEKS